MTTSANIWWRRGIGFHVLNALEKNPCGLTITQAWNAIPLRYDNRTSVDHAIRRLQRRGLVRPEVQGARTGWRARVVWLRTSKPIPFLKIPRRA